MVGGLTAVFHFFLETSLHFVNQYNLFVGNSCPFSIVLSNSACSHFTHIHLSINYFAWLNVMSRTMRYITYLKLCCD